jgi:hemin uptake protein HemP
MTVAAPVPPEILTVRDPMPLARPSIDSGDLLRGSREVLIRHGEQEYRLRHTQNDKLILTK